MAYLLLSNNHLFHKASFVPNSAAQKASNATLIASAIRTLFIGPDKDFTSAQFLVAIRAIEQGLVVVIR